MSVYWKKVIVRIHRGQIVLRGESYNYLVQHHSLDRKIPIGESRFGILSLSVRIRKKVETKLELDLNNLLDEKEKLREEQFLNRPLIRIGHQRRKNKVGGQFVIYLLKWFREKYCIPSGGVIQSGKDYFLPKIELQESGIYLYPIESEPILNLPKEGI